MVFSDNFMESLTAPDTVPSKKAKIVRKKLSPASGNGTAGGPKLSRGSFDQSEEAAKLNESPSTTASGAGNSKKRVKFNDDMGRELVQIRFFEIEEGERGKFY